MTNGTYLFYVVFIIDVLMENSIAQETAVLSLATQVVSSTVGANADSAANIDLKEYRPKKKKSHKLLCLALLDRCDAIQKVNSVVGLVSREHATVVGDNTFFCRNYIFINIVFKYILTLINYYYYSLYS